MALLAASGPSSRPLGSVRSERGVSQKFAWLHIDALGAAILTISANRGVDHVDETEIRKNADHIDPMKSRDKGSCRRLETPRHLGIASTKMDTLCLHIRKARAIFS
jgi:hypothetical protein